MYPMKSTLYDATAVAFNIARGAHPQIHPLIEALKTLTPDERLKVFDAFCSHCGIDDPRCHCWNDE